jgi:peptide/nickel transport system ATP-binding protein
VRDLGTAALYITHDLAVVAQMADRVMVMRHGEVVEEAETRTMLDAPREAYTRSLWAVRNIAPPAKRPPVAGAVPLLCVSDVTARYGRGTPVLNGIGFDIHAGRTRAVVGESGSGKSSAARVIAGLLPPSAGEVQINGQTLPPDYRQRSRAQLRTIQFIYQMADTALNPRQRIGDIIGRPVAFYAGLRGHALRERIREILSDIDLEPDDYIDRFPGELSGGQKQRIGIGRALAAEPALLICDEVTSALDQIVAENILTLLKRLQRAHDLGLMFITHDLSTTRAIADDVSVMRHGEIVEQGTVKEVLDQPKHVYTRQLLASVPQMDPDWLSSRLG